MKFGDAPDFMSAFSQPSELIKVTHEDGADPNFAHAFSTGFQSKCLHLAIVFGGKRGSYLTVCSQSFCQDQELLLEPDSKHPNELRINFGDQALRIRLYSYLGLQKYPCHFFYSYHFRYLTVDWKFKPRSSQPILCLPSTSK